MTTIERANFMQLKDEEIDPVAMITDMFVRNGHPDPHRWVGLASPDILNQELPLQKRRELINRYWRTAIGILECDTSVARFCLMDEGPVQTWLVVFQESVMPVIVQHNLPKADW
jgi:hypothetical protein